MKSWCLFSFAAGIIIQDLLYYKIQDVRLMKLANIRVIISVILQDITLIYDEVAAIQWIVIWK